MKKINLIVSVISIFIVTSIYAQSPSRIYYLSKHDSKLESVNSVLESPRNKWATSAQLGYNLESGDFIDNFGTSARVLLEILGKEHTNRALFVMGNLSSLSTTLDNENFKSKLKELQNSTQGINVGLYPHYIFGDINNNSFTIYGAITYKLNSLKNSNDSLFYFHQTRFAIGLELSGLKGAMSELPVTLSFEPTYIILDKEKYQRVFKKNKSSMLGVNSSLIIPVGKGKGFKIDHLYSKEIGSTFSVGLIFTN